MAVGSQLHEAFCANVRRRRLELGKTQLEIATEMQISQPAYAQIESGRRGPGIDVIANVARALNCDPADLLTIESARKKNSRQSA